MTRIKITSESKVFTTYETKRLIHIIQTCNKIGKGTKTPYDKGYVAGLQDINQTFNLEKLIKKNNTINFGRSELKALEICVHTNNTLSILDNQPGEMEQTKGKIQAFIDFMNEFGIKFDTIDVSDKKPIKNTLTINVPIEVPSGKYCEGDINCTFHNINEDYPSKNDCDLFHTVLSWDETHKNLKCKKCADICKLKEQHEHQ